MRPEFHFPVALAILSAILVKGLVFPGWVTCVELVACLGFVAGRWFFEPKPKPKASKEEMDALRQAFEDQKKDVAVWVERCEELKKSIGQIRLKLGFR